MGRPGVKDSPQKGGEKSLEKLLRHGGVRKGKKECSAADHNLRELVQAMPGFKNIPTLL